MPFTLAHPAAIIPLTNWVREPISISALALGSLSPDFGYYLQAYQLATFAHTPLGSVLFCVPASLVVLFILWSVRHRIGFLLPTRLRYLWMHAFQYHTPISAWFFMSLGFYTGIGAGTHIIWDSFTHKTGWVVQQIAVLSEPLFQIGNVPFATYNVLQHGSSLLGLVVVGIYLKSYLAQTPKPSNSDDYGRNIFWLSVVGLTVIIAIPLAYSNVSPFSGSLALRTMVFQLVVISGGMFCLLLLIILTVVGFLPQYKRSVLRTFN